MASPARAAAKRSPKNELHRQLDHRPRGPRGRPQAARHVHRLDLRARPAPPGVGGRRQLRRRGAGRLRRPHRGHAARRRRRPGHGQRPRHAGRHAPDAEAADRRGHPHRAARRREVRRQGLRGLRRPARRRRLGRQRAVAAGSRSTIERDGFALDQPYVDQKPAEPLQKGEPSTKHRHDASRSGPTPTIFETTDVLVRDDQPPAAGDGVPEQGPDDRAARRARRARSSRRTTPPPTAAKARRRGQGGHLPLRRRHRRLRPPPQRRPRTPIHKDVDLLRRRGQRSNRLSVEIAMQWNASYSESVLHLRQHDQHASRAAPTRRASAPR